MEMIQHWNFEVKLWIGLCMNLVQAPESSSICLYALKMRQMNLYFDQREALTGGISE